MRPIATVGVLLVILGIVAFAVPSFTFFTQERVADVGFFHVDVSKPHTIIINPAVGIIAVVAGLFMIMAGRNRAAI